MCLHTDTYSKAPEEYAPDGIHLKAVWSESLERLTSLHTAAAPEKLALQSSLLQFILAVQFCLFLQVC